MAICYHVLCSQKHPICHFFPTHPAEDLEATLQRNLMNKFVTSALNPLETGTFM